MIQLDDVVIGCTHFQWKEFLIVPSWGVDYVYPNQDVIENIVKTAQTMEKVRRILGDAPIKITSGWRPAKYNKLIDGSEGSAHIEGLACDFQHSLKDAQTCRFQLLAHLESLKIRMEDLDGANWVHIDLREPIYKRYFKP